MPHPLNPIVLSEKFFSWGFRTKFFRQLIPFAWLSIVAFVFYPMGWETGNDAYLGLASFCLVLAAVFGLLVIRTLAKTLRHPGRRVILSALLIVGIYAYIRASQPNPLDSFNFWAGMVGLGAGAVLFIDVVTDAQYNRKLSELANQT